MRKYVFRPYSKQFSRLAKLEIRRIKKILGPDARIEHVGSTAVPDLGGKGIIDIIVSIGKKSIKAAKSKLEAGKYVFDSTGGDKERLFFWKDYKSHGGVRRIHLHLTSHGSSTWKSHVAVRDYLRMHPKDRSEYSRIKKEAVKLAKGKGKLYRQHKHFFLSELKTKALKKYSRKHSGQ